MGSIDMDEEGVGQFHRVVDKIKNIPLPKPIDLLDSMDRVNNGGEICVERTVLDLKGLSCPLPVLKANKAMKELIGGEILEIIATDPAAPKDFEVFCENTGHLLTESSDDNGVFTIVLTKVD